MEHYIKAGTMGHKIDILVDKQIIMIWTKGTYKYRKLFQTLSCSTAEGGTVTFNHQDSSKRNSKGISILNHRMRFRNRRHQMLGIVIEEEGGINLESM